MAISSAPRRVRRACLFSGGVGLAALVATLLSDPHWARGELFAFFLAALIVLQVAPESVLHGAERGENFQVDEALVVPMLLLLPRSETLLALVVSVTARHLLQRRGGWKAVFNAGQMAVAGAVGLAVFGLLTSPGAPLAQRVVAAVVGGFVYCTITGAAVAAVMSHVERVSFRSVIKDSLGGQALSVGGSLSLGVLVAIVGVAHPAALPLVIVPVALLQAAYAGALRQWQERRRTESLYEASAAIRDSMDSARVIDVLLDTARRLLDAEIARLVAPGGEAPDDLTVLRAPLDGTFDLELTGRHGGGRWTTADVNLLRALAGVAASALQHAHVFERLQVVTDSLDEGVLSLSADGLIDLVNPAAERILGAGRAQLSGRALHDVVHGDGHPCRSGSTCALEVATEGLGRAAALQSTQDDVFTSCSGERVPIEFSLSALGGDSTSGAVLAFRDVRERKAFEARLRHQAFHDPLTGLPNRVLFFERITDAQRRVTRTGGMLALLFVDLDRFKLVNDSLGHGVGDHLLVEVAHRLSDCLRVNETLARFGGDEFTVLLEDVQGPTGATAAAQRILEAMRLPFELESRRLTLSASIGVVLTGANAASAEDLLAQADTAMYAAKANGKDCHVVFDPACEAEALTRLDLEIALREALGRSELELYYQPIINLSTGRLAGAEALLRWRHPTLGLLSPGAFVELAEETGLILGIGRWVLEEAATQARRWRDRHSGAPLVVSVNLSARQFQQPQLVDEVHEILERTGIDPSSVCLEITESVIMEDAKRTTAAMLGLKGLGVLLAIDDFGTGYSSLSYLKRFPVDSVKIDRSFVDGLGIDVIDTEVIAAVVRLTGVVGMQVVAEGVTSDEQVAHLRELGCGFAQGFLFFRPLPADEMDALFDAEDAFAPGQAGTVTGHVAAAHR
jgi:diguanylate cyclase (GGDEF)-like protein/PAS domain S-box-containing protein